MICQKQIKERRLNVKVKSKVKVKIYIIILFLFHLFGVRKMASKTAGSSLWLQTLSQWSCPWTPGENKFLSFSENCQKKTWWCWTMQGRQVRTINCDNSEHVNKQCLVEPDKYFANMVFSLNFRVCYNKKSLNHGVDKVIVLFHYWIVTIMDLRWQDWVPWQSWLLTIWWWWWWWWS